MSEAERLRRLSKYEARDEVLFRTDDTPEMEFLSPFGPLIGRTQVPSYLLEHINQHVDGLLQPGKGGEVQLSEEFSLTGGDDSLVHWVAKQIDRYVRGVERSDPDSIQLQRLWVVSQYAETSSPVHFHSGDISGVMYLRVPSVDSQQAEQRNYISGRKAGYINFMIGGKQRFSRSLISFKPVVGEFLVFPGWLLHGAEPFLGTGERRSLAFNAGVVGE
jgi:hypothetical protein